MAPGTDVETFGPKKVLLVEDDEIALRAVARQLTRGGYEVVTATGVAPARAQLAAQGDGRADVVVSDVLLPDGSGLDVLDAARRLDPPIPVLLMTGAADASTVATAFAAGVVRYLRKPLGSVELIDAVVQACRSRPGQRAHTPSRSPTVADSDRRLTAALAELRLLLRPIVSWSRGRVVGYQAAPVADDLDQAALVELARAAGRVPELGRAVRSVAAVRVTTLAPEVGLQINLGVDELSDPELYVEATPLATHAARITLAVGEDAARQDLDQTVHRLALLRAAGFRIGIDELGGGGASLVAMATTRPQTITTASALIRGLRRDSARQAVLRSVHQLAAQLGADVVTRGVDTSEDLTAALDVGGDLVIGDAIAPAALDPAPLDFPKLRRQLGVRRQGRTTQRAPARRRGASLQAPDRTAIARTLCDDLANALGSVAELVAVASDDPTHAHPIGDEARRLLDECQTLVAALAALTDQREG